MKTELPKQLEIGHFAQFKTSGIRYNCGHLYDPAIVTHGFPDAVATVGRIHQGCTDADFPNEQGAALATALAHRYNVHDQLVQALEQVLGPNSTGRDTKQQALAALKAAKGEK